MTTTLRPYIKEKKNTHTHITFRDISSVDMVGFEFDVSEAFSYYINSTEVEREVLCFTNTFNNMVNKHAPLQQKRVKRQYQPQWFNREILLAIALRDRLKRDGDEDGYRKQCNQVLQMLQRAKSNFYNGAMNVIETDTGYGK